jgi:hypothetical protein
MISHYRINPALATRWYVVKNGLKYRMRIAGTYFTGVAQSFVITAYEIKYDHKAEVQVIDAEVFSKHIDDGLVKPDYNDAGQLVY